MNASLIPFMRSNPSLVSQVSVSEPMMPCFDPYCTYPFGATCESCKLELGSRQRRQQVEPEARSNAWIENLSAPKINIDVAEQTFFDGTSKRSTVVTENKEQVREVCEEYEKLSELVYHASESETRSFETVAPYHFRGSLTETSGYPLSSRTDTTSTSCCSNQTTLSTALDPWLSTLFDHTLAGHVSGVDFVGGADEQNPTEDLCSLCFNPIGDPRDQHLLRCQYAHEEREREERAEWLLVRGAELRGRR
ncbi:hypothetical protein BDZ45DRAFT_495001 [Acephala macrosclerotiorum]|nr:hypothetical protein BDZ45DRAFT_495001 [Acephala macrosclerotiorum]